MTTIADPIPTAPAAGPGLRHWLGVGALAVGTYAVAWFAITHTRFSGVSALWVANGLLTGALLLRPRGAWPALFVAAGLGQATARLVVGDALPMVVGVTIANLLECAVVAGWVRRDVDDLRRARSLGIVARDAFASSVAACMLSATLALPLLLTRSGTTWLVAWGTWFTAHLLGMVVVATLTVCAFQEGVRLFGAKGRRLDFLACFALLLGVSALDARTEYSLLFLIYLPLLLLSYRHGLSGMVVGVLTVAAISGISAATGNGSFELPDSSGPVARLVYWQVYVAGACLLAYGTAVAMTQRRQFEERLRTSQARLQAITDNLPAMVARFDRDVRYVYANPLSRSMASGVDLIGKSLPGLRSKEHYAEFKPHVEAVLRGETREFDTWIDGPGGRVLLRAHFVPDVGPDGSVQGFYSLSFDVTKQRAAERELERLARNDALTGLANRRHFEESLQEAAARAQRTGAPLLVLALDLDRFKQINDTLGHAAGDEVLKEFGRRVKASVYDVDLVARLGGDEFVVLVEYSATRESGERIATAIIEAMRAPIDLSGGETVQAATSIGIGLQQPVLSGESLLAAADQALYAAKARGRNAFSF
jgi:diguanylate cyclase (GGDEF)-like protein